MRVTLTRDDLARVIADRFSPQGYTGAVIKLLTPGGLLYEWDLDWIVVDDEPEDRT
jgi:hypothetical protein